MKVCGRVFPRYCCNSSVSFWKSHHLVSKGTYVPCIGVVSIMEELRVHECVKLKSFRSMWHLQSMEGSIGSLKEPSTACAPEQASSTSGVKVGRAQGRQECRGSLGLADENRATRDLAQEEEDLFCDEAMSGFVEDIKNEFVHRGFCQ
uniref:Uncharacterized protein n=1 Tax=Picea sitchensis TaxID=3332 RepID=A9NUB2_PICSI|nr:unknown [Picea sitchensis]